MARPAARPLGVSLPVPLFQEFTYLANDDTPGATVGSRVLVPFGRQRLIGVVTTVDAIPTGDHTLRAVLATPDAVPAFTPSLLETCRRLAEYYVVPLGLVLRAALPTKLTSSRDASAPGRTVNVLRIARTIESLVERETMFRRAPKQRLAYELLESMGGSSRMDHLVDALGASRSALSALVKRGLVAIEEMGVAREPMKSRVRIAEGVEPLTPSQRAAVASITSLRAGGVALLHGVTGSGKTRVYIEVLRAVLERGKSAIVLVPEIALTPQTVDRFRGAFGDQVAVLHSALSEGERLDEWRALRAGTKRIAVGARSAIFAPLSDVGIIVVDEEHEASYKQSETPRYHARDAALVRARVEGGVVVLGSATPSVESWVHAENGRYRLIELPERVAGGALPHVEVVNLTAPLGATAVTDPFRRVLSPPLEDALNDTLGRGEQAIFLLNRRGYAAFIQCRACELVATCPNCSVSLTLHRTPERLLCHYCGHREAVTGTCQHCGQPTARERGLGTQQVERLLGDRFPSARIARMDVDTTSGKWGHARILDRVARAEIDILLGTQMIAKGLDFANVTLVGVIDADIGTDLPEFRASERCFQLLAQVAGRTGRGPKGGRVWIQTRHPKHYAIQAAVAHDVAAFMRTELPERERALYPPYVRLANVLISGLDANATADEAERCAGWLRRLLSKKAPDVTLLGPASCAIERVQKRWRWHLMLKSKDAAPMTHVLLYLLEHFTVTARHGLRLSVDRDPVSLL